MKINSGQMLFQPIRIIFYMSMSSRDPSPIFETSTNRVFVLLFLFFLFLVAAGH